MNQTSRKPLDYLPTLERLSEAARGNDESAFFVELSELTSLHEKALFNEVGRLTRQLHDAITNLDIGPQLSELASEGVPSARDRLDEVVKMTDASAHKTMDLVEASVSSLRDLIKSSEAQMTRWAEIRGQEVIDQPLRTFAENSIEFAAVVRQSATGVKGQLSEVVIAQNYQDLSGQAIRKVSSLLREVEAALIAIIHLAGDGTDASGNGRSRSLRSNGEDRLKNQDEVDDVLSSLGF